jgi:hypothetical protein
MSQITDWRGQEITIGTTVLYHRNSNGIATWGIGKVTKFRSGLYGESLLDIEWSEHTGESRVARGVGIQHVTVWPKPQNLILREDKGSWQDGPYDG